MRWISTFLQATAAEAGAAAQHADGLMAETLRGFSDFLRARRKQLDFRTLRQTDNEAILIDLDARATCARDPVRGRLGSIRQMFPLLLMPELGATYGLAALAGPGKRQI